MSYIVIHRCRGYREGEPGRIGPCKLLGFRSETARYERLSPATRVLPAVNGWPRARRRFRGNVTPDPSSARDGHRGTGSRRVPKGSVPFSLQPAQGSCSEISADLKSATFRVTSVSPCSRDVAAKIASVTDIGRPDERLCARARARPFFRGNHHGHELAAAHDRLRTRRACQLEHLAELRLGVSHCPAFPCHDDPVGLVRSVALRSPGCRATRPAAPAPAPAG